MNNRLYGNLIFELSKPGRRGYTLPRNEYKHRLTELSAHLLRAKEAELPECDEMTVVRHYTNLSHNNFGVNDGFYPLGSCTMKYNPVINEELAALQAFAGKHPLQSVETCQTMLFIYHDLQKQLCALTGLSEFTLNPCAGAHGELTGLMVIRAYHQSRGDDKRTKVIIPDSAHGTNPASAAVCGLEVVEVKSDPDGLVSLEHLGQLVKEQGDSIAAMMMTNPNTLGIFEKDIPEIAQMIHDCGGLMYYDGANLNPMLGYCRPGDMGFDVMHINLHKTFSTPHGGGGPGSGPVGVREGLEAFLPTPRVTYDEETNEYSVETDDYEQSLGSIGSFFGNFGVIIKAYCYILSLGKENIKMVGPLATLNATYIKESLKNDFELPKKFRLSANIVWSSCGDYNNFRISTHRFNTILGVQHDVNLHRVGTMTFDLRCMDIFNTSKTEATIFGIREITTANPARRTFMLNITWKFNEARSKYRGSGAGEKQKQRM